MIAIAVANVPFFARAVRGAVLEIRHQDYIAAARLAGHRGPGIVLGEVLPNLAPTLLVLMTTTLGWMVLETAGLSFLGLGAQPPQADLGSMLGEGREFLTTYPLVAVLPGLVILILVVGINLLGDALRDLLDPRMIGSRSHPRAMRNTSTEVHRQQAMQHRNRMPMIARPALGARARRHGAVDGEGHHRPRRCRPWPGLRHRAGRARRAGRRVRLRQDPNGTGAAAAGTAAGAVHGSIRFDGAELLALDGIRHCARCAAGASPMCRRNR
jgi:hypothetical protein